MDPARWQRMNDLFHAARALAPDDRDPFLASRCAEDADLLDALRRLLHAEEAPAGDLEAPIGSSDGSSGRTAS